jgi:hypothetical protein
MSTARNARPPSSPLSSSLALRRLALAACVVAVCGLAIPLMGQAADQDQPKNNPQGQMPPGPMVPGAPGGPGAGGEKKEDDGLRPFADVSKGFDRVISTADGKEPYLNLWVKKKDGSMIAELPRGHESSRQFIAMTVASGETYAGLQAGDMYVYWKRFDNRMMLIEPNVETRSTGDLESKSSVKRLFTDRVVLDVPILAMGPNGQPVIDMKDLLVGRIGTFFGRSAGGANAKLATIKSAKAFPENVEISWEMPVGPGTIKEFHYSISVIKDNTGYAPRPADERVGYFTTISRDLGKFEESQKWIRYVNRWQLEKADPKLKLSPPKEPIVFYIESSVPVRYRRFVREGLLEWNKAFEKIGILDAIEVYQQDERTGAHMDKDPEDVRYNFVRWLSNDIGTAIGPSRTHPLTGQILDADIILTDGWIRHFWTNFNELMPELAMEGFSPETLAWLDRKPQWDPRIRLAPPEQRDFLLAQRARRGIQAYGGHPIAAADPSLARTPMVGENGVNEFVGMGRPSQVGLCLAAKGKGFDVTQLRMMLDLIDADQLANGSAGSLTLDDPPADGDKDDKKDEKKDKKKDETKGDMLDGIPDWFIGPLLMDLTAHECGHTLGLRHNFKSSSLYTMQQIASEDLKKKVFVGSVMDYTPINLNVENGKLQGNIGPSGIGPYDFWAIEYGYGFGDPKDVLKRVAEPDLVYGTDEDVGGPDPLIRRYDFAKDPLEFAKSQMKLANYHRERLLSKFVKDGQSWAKARRGYQITLGLQVRSINMMSAWIGGAHVNRDRKGDPNGRPPIEVVPVEQQRDALKWVIENSFNDQSFGLTPELLTKMTVDKWIDAGGFAEGMQDNTWPIHDRIAGIQAATMTMILNPTTLRRTYDNEFLIPEDKDTLTVAEVMDTVYGGIWGEVEKPSGDKSTARKPAISSLRRNLQREHVERLIEMSLPGAGDGQAFKVVSNLATQQLRKLRGKITEIVGEKGDKGSWLDPYSFAHLSEAKVRIDKALDANYIYNTDMIGGGGFGGFFFGKTTESPTTGSPDGLRRSPDNLNR